MAFHVLDRNFSGQFLFRFVEGRALCTRVSERPESVDVDVLRSFHPNQFSKGTLKQMTGIG